MITGTIDEILQHKPANLWTIAADATVFDAIQLMAEKNIGALLVMERNPAPEGVPTSRETAPQGRLVGVVSERDYTRKVALKGKSSRETQVREILSTPLIAATPRHTVEECMRLMTDHRVRHLPVLEHDRVV